MAPGRKLDRKRQRLCSIAAPASKAGVPGAARAALPGWERHGRRRELQPGDSTGWDRVQPRSRRRFLPFEIVATAVVPGLTSSSSHKSLTIPTTTRQSASSPVLQGAKLWRTLR